MRIGQGVKFVEESDNKLTVNPNEYYVKAYSEDGYTIHQARKDNPYKLVVIVPEEKQLAIKIAKLLNEDFKRGDV